ncbi:MAG: SsrA-binding protein SmpB [Parcubacteria group bacterium]|nr:SsrA-binding protein SmpB [Parcubacteria group bacterium]
MPILAENKKAYFDYQILDTYEAGLVLSGQEVKSIRLGRIDLRASYIVIKKEELWLINASIASYQPQNTSTFYEPTKSRKLLLRKKEIKSLIGKSKEKGLTLMPLKVYTKSGKIKLEFGIAKGKKQFEKREQIKKRETERKMREVLKKI